MENELAQLTINEDEDDVIQIQENPGMEKTEEFFQMVGCFLIASIIYFPAMKSTMANLWHPVRGVRIRDLGEKGHNDSFCEAKMLIGVEIIKMGWDLSIRAQSRRALFMNSVWLREDGKGAIGGIDEGNRGFARGLQRMEHNKSYGKAVDPIIGFNAEGGLLCEDEK
ncbi:hypothetical protein Goari_027474 [Gossypium aridum]|uniref:Uncharacterized protein n=1 Tax=Gossypium aridum TaxID=34290 RepID=A0A7J8YQA8_GOSAI|nr:hypothetical protein [Gossypium aridum]